MYETFRSDIFKFLTQKYHDLTAHQKLRNNARDLWTDLMNVACRNNLGE